MSSEKAGGYSEYNQKDPGPPGPYTIWRDLKKRPVGADPLSGGKRRDPGRRDYQRGGSFSV